MQFGPYGWHQWRKAKPTEKAYKKHEPGGVKSAHLHALDRKYIEFGELILHDLKIYRVINSITCLKIRA